MFSFLKTRIVIYNSILKIDHSEALHDTSPLVKQDDNLYNFLVRALGFPKYSLLWLELDDLNRLTPYTIIELELEYDFSKMDLVISSIVHIYANRKLKIHLFYG